MSDFVIDDKIKHTLKVYLADSSTEPYRFIIQFKVSESKKLLICKIIDWIISDLVNLIIEYMSSICLVCSQDNGDVFFDYEEYYCNLITIDSHMTIINEPLPVIPLISNEQLINHVIPLIKKTYDTLYLLSP